MCNNNNNIVFQTSPAVVRELIIAILLNTDVRLCFRLAPRLLERNETTRPGRRCNHRTHHIRMKEHIIIISYYHVFFVFTVTRELIIINIVRRVKKRRIDDVKYHKYTRIGRELFLLTKQHIIIIRIRSIYCTNSTLNHAW